MARFVRVLTLISALLMVAVYFYPLWGIGLVAPQYPEGLAIEIWINKITGDVRNINLLNHYIGMSKIEPDNIPELKSFPYLFGFLIGSGILAAIFHRPKLYKIWAGLVLGGALLGLYDFYSWEYRYGHDLSDDAPMKLEESYQPPLIGSKQLANITASSWPRLGGYAFSTSAILALLILVLPARPRKSGRNTLAVLLMGMILGSCSKIEIPEQIQLGRDECDTCRMVIVDGKFGGELVTQKGKVYKFDSFDCLKSFYLKNSESIQSQFVFDFNDPGRLLPVAGALFYKLEQLRSPMGSAIVAVGTGNSATEHPELGLKSSGMDWNTVIAGNAE